MCPAPKVIQPQNRSTHPSLQRFSIQTLTLCYILNMLLFLINSLYHSCNILNSDHAGLNKITSSTFTYVLSLSMIFIALIELVYYSCCFSITNPYSFEPVSIPDSKTKPVTNHYLIPHKSKGDEELTEKDAQAYLKKIKRDQAIRCIALFLLGVFYLNVSNNLYSNNMSQKINPFVFLPILVLSTIITIFFLRTMDTTLSSAYKAFLQNTNENTSSTEEGVVVEMDETDNSQVNSGSTTEKIQKRDASSTGVIVIENDEDSQNPYSTPCSTIEA
jgi:hypothetical protein